MVYCVCVFAYIAMVTVFKRAPRSYQQTTISESSLWLLRPNYFQVQIYTFLSNAYRLDFDTKTVFLSE